MAKMLAAQEEAFTLAVYMLTALDEEEHRHGSRRYMNARIYLRTQQKG